MTETMIVGLIVIVAGTALVRHFCHSALGKKKGCGCGNGSCPMSGVCSSANKNPAEKPKVAA
jgi:hypothetical protein